MRYVFSRYIAAISILMMALACATNAEPRTESLVDRSIELHLTNCTLLYALNTLAVDKRIPIGLELMLSHKAEYNVNINVDNAKLKDVLDLLVQQQPNYIWEERDGVINFLPVRSRDTFVEEFLNMRVPRFQPKGQRSIDVRDGIINLPEVQRLLRAQGVTASRYGYFQRNTYPDRELDLSIFETDVRGILNKFIRQSEDKMWIVSRSGEKLESLDIGL